MPDTGYYTEEGSEARDPAALTAPKPADDGGFAGFQKRQQTILDRYTQESQKALDERQKITAETVPQLEAMQKQYLDMAAKPVPLPRTPQLQPIPQAPQPKFEDPYNAFGNPLVVMSMLGGLLTRQPATAALSAGAAAMNAYHEGNKEKIELTRQNFEDKMRTVLAQNEQQVQMYNAQMQNSRLSMEQKLTNMSAIAHAFNNQEMIAAIKTGNADAALKIADGLMTAQQGANQEMYRYQEFRERQDEVKRQHDLMEQSRQEQAALRADALEERKRADLERERQSEERLAAIREGRASASQVQRQGFINEAKDQIQALAEGTTVSRGGISITPDMWKQFSTAQTPPVIGMTQQQKAMDDMRKAASGYTPGTPSLSHTPGQRPGRGAVAPPVIAIPNEVIKARGGQVPDGTTFTIDGVHRYMVQGDHAVLIGAAEAVNPNAAAATNPYAGAAGAM